MTIELLQLQDVPLFKAYCLAHRSEVDDSYLYDEDLEAFEFSKANPTYILKNESGTWLGVASLMELDYLDGQKRGRIRILHVESGLPVAYDLLIDAIKDHLSEYHHIFGFIAEVNMPLVTQFMAHDYVIDRYSCVMVRGDLPSPEPTLPESFTLRVFEYNKDEWAYLKVRNAAFATLKGSETPQTLESLQSYQQDSTHMAGGIQMIWKGEEPVGLIRIFKETEGDIDYAFVAPIAILPDYQGMGFGRQLLRAGITFGQKNQMPCSMLTVNAENDRALALYLQEGYVVVEKMICMRLDGMKKS